MGTIGSWGLHTQVQPRFGALALSTEADSPLLFHITAFCHIYVGGDYKNGRVIPDHLFRR